MRIGIQTWGSDGDVRPFLALAGRLSAAGHDVTLAATHLENRDHGTEARALGFRLLQVGCVDERLVRAMGERLLPVRDPLRQISTVLRELFDPFIDEMLSAARGLCRDNELVIGHVLVHPLQAAAERSKVPRIAVALAPLIPSGRIPFPGAPSLGTCMNALLWKLGGAVMNRLLLDPVNRLRMREGLPQARNMMNDVYRSAFLNLVAASPSLVSRPPDWDGSIEVCGAFVLPGHDGPAGIPPALEQFLQAGPPPVYMTFGSMLIADPQASHAVALLYEAALLAGCRAIVQCDRVGGIPESQQVFRIGRSHHDSIFPRCAAVVHHGGAGTVHAAGRAGCPQVIVQHATDQAFWGALLHRQGIAPRPLDRRKVTAPALARAIRTALASPAMREMARRTGASMGSEDGAARAVELIEARASGHAAESAGRERQP